MRGSNSPALQHGRAVFGRSLFLLAIISLFLPAIAYAQPIVIYDGPIAQPVDNPCLGEVVLVEGRLTSTVYPRFDQTGGTHLTVRFIVRGKGVTFSSLFQPAKEYVFNSEFVQEINVPSSGTFEETTILNHILIRRSETDGTAGTLLGTGEDFMWKQTAHMTISNGAPRVAFEKGHTRCM
jgi:hypothetical protein